MISKDQMDGLQEEYEQLREAIDGRNTQEVRECFQSYKVIMPYYLQEHTKKSPLES